MANLDGAQRLQRGKELAPARALAFKLWQENPQINRGQLDQALKEKGFEVHRGTRDTWLSRFKKGSMPRTYPSQPRAKARSNSARQLAFTLCAENPQITRTELSQALKERGFEVPYSTAVTWLIRFKKRGMEGISNPAQALARKLWEENPQITGPQLAEALKEKGFVAHKSTHYNWLRSFRAGKGAETEAEVPTPAVTPSEIPLEEPSRLNLEQIIEAAGSVEALSVLFYQGVMRELGKKDATNHLLKQECLELTNKIAGLKRTLEEVTRDRNRMMREYNEKLAKIKVGTLTLDESARRLIPRVRERGGY